MFNTDKLVSGTNLWIRRIAGVYDISYLSETSHVNIIVLADEDDVIMFVKGFRACLRHVNGVELKDV